MSIVVSLIPRRRRGHVYFTTCSVDPVFYTRCLGIRSSSQPPGPHGYRESCSYHMSFPTLSFSLTGVFSGYTAPNHAKRDRLRRRTKNYMSRLRRKKKPRQSQAFCLIVSFSTPFLDVSGRTRATYIFY